MKEKWKQIKNEWKNELQANEQAVKFPKNLMVNMHKTNEVILWKITENIFKKNLQFTYIYSKI